jgi:hypothetical protein
MISDNASATRCRSWSCPCMTLRNQASWRYSFNGTGLVIVWPASCTTGSTSDGGAASCSSIQRS